MPSMVGPLTFRFLNETRGLGELTGARAPSDLWLYNLHYFDDLNARDAEQRRAWHLEALAEWIEKNPPMHGDGWAAYPTSLRMVNWIKWSLGGAPLDPRALESLAMQARALRGRLEYHLLGNHLFANAKALVFAGLYFKGPEADGWLAEGLSILAREIPEQILDDGGQFERSPMYHALAFEDVLDLVNIFAAYPEATPARVLAASLPAVAQRMRTWLRTMCHPDGEIAFFNDAALGVSPSPAELERYADSLIGASPPLAWTGEVHTTALPASGYVRIDAPQAVLLADVAPIGPDYLPGHAHADTLTFELSLSGRRVIVNCGTSRYGTGPERERERGTPAHNTVTVDGEDSSEVWAGFRVARRARPVGLELREGPGEARLSCAHDGYRRLRGRPTHRRTWTMSRGRLRIDDAITGQFESATARLHLHPDIRCEVNPPAKAGRLWTADGGRIEWTVAGGSARVESSFYAAEFGRREPTACIAIDFTGPEMSFELSW